MLSDDIEMHWKHLRRIRHTKIIIQNRYTLKHTNKLNGIVMQTSIHDNTIKAFPHDADSGFSFSSATVNTRLVKQNKWQKK